MKVPKGRPQKAISDFGTFIVTCTYSDKPLLGSEPWLLEIMKKAIRHGTQNQSMPGLVPVGKRDE